LLNSFKPEYGRKHAAYPPAIAVLQAAGDLADNGQHRPVQYLNNVLEQDHQAIKRRINASQHFRLVSGVRGAPSPVTKRLI
jgi:transposase-like protein